jgi:hypothetical protein
MPKGAGRVCPTVRSRSSTEFLSARRAAITPLIAVAVSALFAGTLEEPKDRPTTACRESIRGCLTVAMQPQLPGRLRANPYSEIGSRPGAAVASHFVSSGEVLRLHAGHSRLEGPGVGRWGLRCTEGVRVSERSGRVRVGAYCSDGLSASTRPTAGSASAGLRTSMIFAPGAWLWTMLRIRLNQRVLCSVGGSWGS